MSDYTLFVGIDIAAASATVAYARARDAIAAPFTIQQTPAGFATLQARLAATGHTPTQTLVVVEATGTYWMRLAVALHAAGFSVSVINPRQAHHFAATRLRHAKTDPLDAVLLTELAILLQPAPWTPPVAQYEQLRQRLARRDDLVHMRTQERNRLHALRQCPVITPHVQADLEDHPSPTSTASSPPTRAWPRSRTSQAAASRAATGSAPRATPVCAPPSTWRPCRRRNTTPPSSASMIASARAASPRRWPAARQHASLSMLPAPSSPRGSLLTSTMFRPLDGQYRIYDPYIARFVIGA
ncbi:MAG: transposase [Anaerolineae bacterium]|nr:transposase [Anaerolineae bacterium]